MGHVAVLREFHSDVLGHDRTVRVYTPTAYDEHPDRRFPVLYMHDGQNVFNHPASARFETWCANDVIERLVHEGRIAPWIVVGVDHGHGRFEEYSPWPEERLGIVPDGDRYAHFITHEVKPFVDRHYRTLADARHTAVAGASLGGLMSLYMGLRYPQVYGRLGGFSPSVMWAQGRLYRHWTAHTGAWSRIYLDAGEHESVWWEGIHLDYGRETKAFYDHLRGLGYAPWELRLWLEPGGNHHEIDWQRRFPEAMAWLLAEV